MINFDEYTNESKTEHNSKRPYFPDLSYRILIQYLINNQPDTDKIYL